jgi:hypothetical protein
MAQSDQNDAGNWRGHYLVRQGQAFPIIGAEVHNSSSSTVTGIHKSFRRVSDLGANTVLAPVAWNLLEPTEGTFDTALIDAMVSTARELGLALIPLWFGTWKNAVSTYAPAWVKTDQERFPRACGGGRRLEHLSAFSSDAKEADSRAFAALMRRIREVDADRTVIAVQVENEIGLLGDTRDRGPLAEAAFASAVPAAVLDAVAREETMPLHAEWRSAGASRHGSWAEVFPDGDRTDEAFMASAFASYTEFVAAAGAQEHDVPLFVNAWLDADSVLDGPVALAGGKRPGDYPSGGPVIPVAAIWEALAPTLDFLAVDLYVADAEPAFAAYRGRRGRLFIPELRADVPGIAQMFSAIGGHRALGVSPFGVDSFDLASPEAATLTDAYGLLRAAAALISANSEAPLHGFALDDANPSVTLEFDDVVVTVHTRDEWGMYTPTYPGYGIAIQADGGVYVLGRGFWITYASRDGREIGLLSADHYRPDGDGLTLVSRLNGDEAGSVIPFPFAGSPLVPGRAIPTRIPDGGITHLVTYTY